MAKNNYFVMLTANAIILRLKKCFIIEKNLKKYMKKLAKENILSEKQFLSQDAIMRWSNCFEISSQELAVI